MAEASASRPSPPGARRTVQFLRACGQVSVKLVGDMITAVGKDFAESEAGQTFVASAIDDKSLFGRAWAIFHVSTTSTLIHVAKKDRDNSICSGLEAVTKVGIALDDSPKISSRLAMAVRK